MIVIMFINMSEVALVCHAMCNDLLDRDHQPTAVYSMTKVLYVYRYESSYCHVTRLALIHDVLQYSD